MEPITYAIPFYKGLGYLERAIESLHAQTDPNWQAHVCDNSASTEAEELVRRVGRGRIRYLSNGTNIGMVPNFNRCIDTAETDLVTIVHADDELMPNYGQTMRAAAERYPEAVALYCRVEVIDEASRRSFSMPHFVKGSIDPARKREVVLEGEPGVRALLRGNFIPAATLCFRRSRLGDRRFLDHYKFVLDWELTLGLLLDGEKIVGVPERCLRNRAHPDATTEHLTRSHQRFTEEVDFYDRMEKIVRERGWERCAAVARARRFTKLHIAYRALRSLVRFDVADARHGIALLRRRE
jgi:GT2 family glycosyltransferase